MPKVEAYLSLEASMSGRLGPKWDKYATKITTKVAAALDKDDVTKAVEIIETMDLSKIMAGEHSYIKFLFTSALLFGATRLNVKAKETSIARGDKVPSIVVPAVKQYKLMLENANITLKKAAYAALDEIEAIRLAEEDAEYSTNVVKGEEDKIRMKDVLDPKIKTTGNSLIDIGSSLQMARLAGYGYLIEARATGVTKYAVNEQLDNRTCPVCRTMHGKVFEVKTAYEKVDTLLRVDDPADLRSMAPWPKQNKDAIANLRGMSSEDLVKAGWDTPPYHPRCRGLLDYIGNVITYDETQTPIDTIDMGSMTQTVTEQVLLANIALEISTLTSATKVLEAEVLLTEGNTADALFLLGLDADGRPLPM
jgi:hypothetical protein